ncbi:MAG: hypothetical protein RIR77_1457 [Planctomycetota bacterium]|jgi:tetratricopeptide (TPR) repeat protein
MKKSTKSDLEQQLERLAEDDIRMCGKKSVSYANTLRVLARVQVRAGKLTLAERNLKRSVKILKESSDADPSDLAKATAQLGCLYQSTDRPDDANPLLQFAASHRGSVEPAELFSVLWALGMVHFVQKDFEGAVRTLNEAKIVAADLFGSESNQVATLNGAIGRSHWKLNNLDEASVHLRQSLDYRMEVFRCNPETKVVDREVSLGSDPDLIDLHFELGTLYYQSDNHEEAEAILRPALRAIDSDLGQDHYLCGRFLHLLALVRAVQGDNAEAEQLLLRAIEMKKSIAGEEGERSVSDSAFELGKIYFDQQRYDDANLLLIHAWDWRPKRYRSDRRSGEIQGYTGMTFKHQGEYTLAEVFLKCSLEVFDACDGPGSTAVAIVLRDLAVVCDALGKSKSAAAYLSRANDIGANEAP